MRTFFVVLALTSTFVTPAASEFMLPVGSMAKTVLKIMFNPESDQSILIDVADGTVIANRINQSNGVEISSVCAGRFVRVSYIYRATSADNLDFKSDVYFDHCSTNGRYSAFREKAASSLQEDFDTYREIIEVLFYALGTDV